nr:reverse transcriptase domain-containing protein [Tanacetum cinerariifolium]
MAAKGNGDPLVLDLRTMEELCQPSLNGRGGPISPIAIQSIKINRVTDDALRLYLFPHSLTHHATTWFDRLPRNSIQTFEQMAKMFLRKYFPPSMVTKLRNEITNFRQRPDESLFEAWERYKLSIDRCPNHNILPVTQIDTFYNGLTLRHRDTINAAAGGTFMKRRTEECYDLIENMTAYHNDWDTSAQRTIVGITQNVYDAGAYQGPTIPTTSSSLPPVIERETEATKDTVPPTNNESIKDVQHLVFQTESPILNSELVVSPTIKPVVSPVSALKPNQRPSIPYLSRLHDQKLHFDADPRIPLILVRSFLKIRRALIDMFEGELTLRVGKEDITFNLDQTSRYSANYNDMTTNQIDVIDMACEEYLQEVLEVDAFLALEDDPTSPEVDQCYFNSEGDILLLEAFLNDDPSLPPPNQRNYMPQVRKELKICEAKTDKSSIDEPPEVELKDLPPPSRIRIFGRLKIFSEKLKTCWSGPFTISHVFPYGTVELSQPDGPNFKVNGRRLKHYFGEDIPKVVVPDLQTFPKNQ